MSDKTEKIDKFAGVWALISTTGGVAVICRFSTVAFANREEVESFLSNSSNPWVPIENAYTLMMVPTVVNNRPAIAPVSAPFGQILGDKQNVSFRVSNIVSVAFFDEMDPTTVRAMKGHIERGQEESARVMRAASAGIITPAR